MRVRYTGPPETSPSPELAQALEGQALVPGLVVELPESHGRDLVKTRFFTRVRNEKAEETPDVAEA